MKGAEVGMAADPSSLGPSLLASLATSSLQGSPTLARVLLGEGEPKGVGSKCRRVQSPKSLLM
jgi:hypothetical protein